MILRPILLAVAGLLAACASGPTAEPEPLRKIAEPEVRGELLWSRKPGGARDHAGLRPHVDESGVVAGNPRGEIRIYDAEGVERARYEHPARFSAGPAVAGDLLVFGTREGYVVAFDRNDGSERWRLAVSSEVLSPPLIRGGVVVVRAGDGRIYGLAADDGARLWASDRTVPPLVLRGTGALVADDRAVYAGLDNGRLIALGLEDGEPLWEEVVSVPSGRSEVERIVDVDAELLLIDGILFAASYGGDMVAVRAASGAVLWRRTMRAYTGIDTDGTCVYVTDLESVLWCLDPANGAAYWKQEQLRYRGLSAPLAFKGNVLVGDAEGYVHWVSAAGGRIIGRMRVGSKGFRVPPLAVDGRVYLLDRAGKLNVIDAKPLSAG